MDKKLIASLNESPMNQNGMGQKREVDTYQNKHRSEVAFLAVPLCLQKKNIFFFPDSNLTVMNN